MCEAVFSDNISESVFLKGTDMDIKNIADILIKRLSLDDLSILCDSWDDGSLDDVFSAFLLPIDLENHPEKYCKPDEDILDAKECV